MPIDYSKVSNEQLAEIIKKSPAVKSLPEDVREKFLASIVGLSPEEKRQLIKSLESKRAVEKELSNNEKTAVFKQGAITVQNLAKDFSKETLVEREKIDTVSDQKNQDKLWDELNNV